MSRQPPGELGDGTQTVRVRVGPGGSPQPAHGGEGEWLKVTHVHRGTEHVRTKLRPPYVSMIQLFWHPFCLTSVLALVRRSPTSETLNNQLLLLWWNMFKKQQKPCSFPVPCPPSRRDGQRLKVSNSPGVSVLFNKRSLPQCP